MHSVLRVNRNNCIRLLRLLVLTVLASLFVTACQHFRDYCLLAVCISYLHERQNVTLLKEYWNLMIPCCTRQRPLNSSVFRTSVTALHSLGTESGSSLCAQSKSWALLCPWRWWCPDKSTCSPEWEGCGSSPPSPAGEANDRCLVCWSYATKTEFFWREYWKKHISSSSAVGVDSLQLQMSWLSRSK